MQFRLSGSLSEQTDIATIQEAGEVHQHDDGSKCKIQFRQKLHFLNWIHIKLIVGLVRGLIDAWSINFLCFGVFHGYDDLVLRINPCIPRTKVLRYPLSYRHRS